MNRFSPFFVPLSALLIAACSSGAATTSTSSASTSGSTGGSSGSTTSTGAASGGADAGTDAGPIGGDRPVNVIVPAGYTPGKAAPLLILLHGYSASGAIEDAYLGVAAEADKRGFLYAHPDGTIDSQNNRFWNASDACCNLDPVPSKVDDSAYLSKLIADISAHYTVDPKRVYFFGHSNGGFMSYRMACEHADKIAAIVTEGEPFP